MLERGTALRAFWVSYLTLMSPWCHVCSLWKRVFPRLVSSWVLCSLKARLKVHHSFKIYERVFVFPYSWPVSLPGIHTSGTGRGCVGFITDETPAPSVASICHTAQTPSQYLSKCLQDGSWGNGPQGKLNHACNWAVVLSGFLCSCWLWFILGYFQRRETKGFSFPIQAWLLISQT